MIASTRLPVWHQDRQVGSYVSRFAGCLRCPGLVIPIDVEHLARILQAQDAPGKRRDRLDPRRWDLLYAPSYRP